VIYWCERAWLPGGVVDGVRVRVDDGVIAEVSTSDVPPSDSVRLNGVVLPGFANAHSHAFHRALRGRTHADGGTFWTWRQAMYQLAERLTPETYLKLATAVYAEMAVAGISCVGEFHYLHHGPGGTPYADPNEMGHVLREAAATAGIRITLLDTCYVAGGIGTELTGTQLRFSDGNASRWAERVSVLQDDSVMRVGAAIHSVRGVPREQLADVAAVGGPLHVHLSEQPAENEACLAVYGKTPTAMLADAGVLSARTTAVHATHLTIDDRELLGGSRTTACFCPTTEADLADGIGPARELVDAGCPLSLGSDQHVVIDPLVETRALEHGERLRTGNRGRFSPAELLTAATEAGHACLGWPGAGRIAVGAPADLVAVRLDSVRTSGSRPEQVLLTADSSDVDTVVTGGRVVATGGRHATLGEVGPLLADVMGELWQS
jgi:formiminoglutamate deiminase